MAFKRHRATKNKTPAIHRPSKSLGKNDGIKFAGDVVAAVVGTDATSAEIVELTGAAVPALTVAG
jgi:hypothetical protein